MCARIISRRGIRSGGLFATRVRSQRIWQSGLKTGTWSCLKLTCCRKVRNGSKACAGVEFVAHVASPFFIGCPPSEAEEKLYKPARQGTENVFQGAWMPVL
mmetsp:Transcript_6854/g.12143  ORF Transcript_6854/g.12143 Transcript_6854/m.12143 type:complete len:101 (-) Transcript_6854:1252-1554(-)